MAVALFGCGYKNLPVPPDKVVPKAVEDLRFVEQDRGGRLEWTYPVESVTGQDLPEIDSFELFQAMVPERDYCPTCPIPFGQPQALPAGESTIQGKKRTASAPLPRLVPGNKYFFKVRSRTSWWVSSDDSNVVTFVWKVAASVPQGLNIKAGRENIALAWQPVRVMADGSPLTAPAHYQVQRSDDGQAFVRIAVVDSPRYTDNAVRPGQKYFYRVQALIRVDGQESAGALSHAASATLIETPPLAPPSGVGIALTAAGARVYWDSAESAAGYRIYRRAATEGDYQRLGDARAEANIFIDTSAKEGVTYFYVVTTLGADGEESAPSRPASSRW
ncbi:MAG TPA: hypothetical protein DEB25_05500 [Desulfobulbaceae bacterium]|nr:hypothetical protein [Desulfobulbaceae bacterium]